MTMIPAMDYDTLAHIQILLYSSLRLVHIVLLVTINLEMASTSFSFILHF
jgi:hypothetical protein